MDETDKKIRELTEAMHAERDIRIRNRMSARNTRGIRRGVLRRRGPAHGPAVGGAVRRRHWPPGRSRKGIHARGTGGSGRRAGKNMLTPLRNWIRLNRYSLCRCEDPALPGFSSVPRLGRTPIGKAVAGRRRRHLAPSRPYFSELTRKEAVVARRGSSDASMAGGTEPSVRRACRGRNPADAADGPTFVRYLKEVRRKWGKVLLVTDNASQHKHREVRQYRPGSVPAYCTPSAQSSPYGRMQNTGLSFRATRRLRT